MIDDKLAIYQCDISAPKLAKKSICDVTEKGKAAKVRANQLAAELSVFSAGPPAYAGWKSSFPLIPRAGRGRGQAIGAG